MATGGTTAKAAPCWSPTRTRAAVGSAVLLGLVHALVVAHRYHVGSFDDDAAYVLLARAIAAGHGLTSRLAGGYPLVGVYPPGYPALLSPLAVLWPMGELPFRALSLVLLVAVFALTWVYLGRREVAPGVRLAVLGLMALNPVLATYATMVMPEMAFLVVLLILLLAVDRWVRESTTITGAGVATVVAAGGLLWLKEAGIGLVAGLVLWLILRRRFRKAVLAAVVPVVLFLPLLVVRSLAGANLIGSRYSGDLGGSFQGGLGATIRHLVPEALKTYYTHAIPHSIVPTDNGLLPTHGLIEVVWVFLAATAVPVLVVGFVLWCRRHADAACLMVPVYLAETLVYPFINERRVILVLPVILAWYSVGWAWLFTGLWGLVRHWGRGLRSAVRIGLPALVSVLVVVALTSQFTRDYLYFEGADSSSPGGSPYMAFLHRAGTLGPSGDIVETDYLWTTALDTGHRTANAAYLVGCDRQPVVDAMAADRAGYVLTASLNGSGPVDQACLLPVLGAVPGAVRLYRTPRDRASVYELVGPGTGHPSLRDLTGDAAVDGGTQPVVTADEVPQDPADPAGRYPTVAAVAGVATLTWSWRQPVVISQLSLGGAGALPGASAGTVSVRVALRGADGQWRTVAAVPGPVGSGTGTPFVLLTPSPAAVTTAVRVSVAVPGSGPVGVHDFHALGPTGPGAG